MLTKFDILIEKSGGGENQPVGRAIQFDLDEKSVCSNFVGRIVLSSNVYSRYFAYLLNAFTTNRINVRSIKQTTGLQNLDLDFYLQERVFIPDLTEQKKIASFLDTKTVSIDNLISQKEKLIEKLKEERTQAINHAVTKGLKENVKMKSSKITWIGDIPNDWEIVKLKYITNYFKGFAFKSADFSETGIPIIKASNIKNWQIENITDFIDLENQKEEFEKIRLKKGDIILSTVGSKPDVTNSAVGQIAIVNSDFENSYLNQNTICIRANKIVNTSFLKFITFCHYFRANLDFYSAWIANQAYLEIEDILSIPVPLPTIAEQESISNYLETLLLHFRNTISKIEKEIELIKEYKEALISEVVTGKNILN